MALYFQGKYAAAEESLREAFRLKPTYARARADLGELLGEEGRYAEAVQAFQEAIAVKPHRAVSHRLLGGALLAQGRLAEAEAALREAQVAARFAARELERAEELTKNGAGSVQHIDDMRSRYEGAAARVAAAEAKRETLTTQLGYARVTSPLAGRVLDVPVEEGSAVSPVTAVTGGTLLLSLAATSAQHLEGLVDENEVARVALGQPARLRTEAFGEQTFSGRVSKISPVGQRVQNVTYFEVEVEVTGPGGEQLRPRMSGDAEIVTEVVEDALLVPESALRYRGAQIYVEAKDSDGFAQRDVRIGIVDGTRVQVEEGLAEGDEVVLR